MKIHSLAIYKKTCLWGCSLAVLFLTLSLPAENKISIDQLELTFENGKYYQVISRNSGSLRYQLKIKGRGQGILKGSWLLDEKPMGFFSISINGPGIYQPENFQLLPLPVNNQGLHTVTVELANFQWPADLPIIRYFVTTLEEIEIIYPQSGAKGIERKEILLKWQSHSAVADYEIAVSEKPFQFLKLNQIQWMKVSNPQYLMDLSVYKAKEWLYWQVREITPSGNVLTTSEIASFKLKK